MEYTICKLDKDYARFLVGKGLNNNDAYFDKNGKYKARPHVCLFDKNNNLWVVPMTKCRKQVCSTNTKLVKIQARMDKEKEMLDKAYLDVSTANITLEQDYYSILNFSNAFPTKKEFLIGCIRNSKPIKITRKYQGRVNANAKIVFPMLMKGKRIGFLQRQNKDTVHNKDTIKKILVANDEYQKMISAKEQLEAAATQARSSLSPVAEPSKTPTSFEKAQQYIIENVRNISAQNKSESNAPAPTATKKRTPKPKAKAKDDGMEL